jgi:hypothetical protein
MALNHSRRLDRLEEIHAPSDRPERWHQVIGESDAELEMRMNEMIASGEAKPSDGFIRHLIVDPRK